MPRKQGSLRVVLLGQTHGSLVSGFNGSGHSRSNVGLVQNAEAVDGTAGWSTHLVLEFVRMAARLEQGLRSGLENG